MSAMTELLAALKSGETPTIAMRQSVLGERSSAAYYAAKGDIKAAIDFTEAALPGYSWSIARMGQAMGQAIVWDTSVEGDALLFDHTCHDNPARALLIAALMALVAKETPHDDASRNRRDASGC